jgi:Flp pilus assembly protein TadD
MASIFFMRAPPSGLSVDRADYNRRMTVHASVGPTLQFWYGRLLTRYRRKARALEVFRAVVRDQPHHQRAWSCIGFLLAENEQFESAAHAFGRARALEPRDSAASFNVGYMLQRLGRHEQALEYFGCALQLDRGMGRAWYAYGVSLMRLGRLADAVSKFEEAARLQPSDPHPGYQLASIWHQLGDRDKLRIECERVGKLDQRVAERIRLDFGADLD